MYPIESLENKYNPDNDVDVDFAWIDYELLMLIKRQQQKIEELEERLENLEEAE